MTRKLPVLSVTYGDQLAVGLKEAENELLTAIVVIDIKGEECGDVDEVENTDVTSTSSRFPKPASPSEPTHNNVALR